MHTRRRMKDRYRRFSYLTDIAGIRSAIAEAKGKGFPKQPRLGKECRPQDSDTVMDEQWFIDTIRDKLANHPENRMEYPYYGERIFGEPLVGFVRGDDPLLYEYKRIIGPHHFTPEEIMKWQADKNGVPAPKADELSVVSFIMPITERTNGDNAAQKDWVSERWAQTRLIGEIFSQTVVREIVTSLMKRGILAVAPDVTPMFTKKRYPVVGWASPWSHRHMAYAAGLGSFGIHDFLITEKGSAHRAASFVVNLKLKPNRERTKDIHANCLHYQGIKCLRCKSRCPVGAISEEKAHDKEACMRRVASSTKYCNSNYHIFIYGCGLCATGTPCESGIPDALQRP
jgi:epoxyqueuosine reductase